jgi:hypothetical protein
MTTTVASELTASAVRPPTKLTASRSKAPEQARYLVTGWGDRESPPARLKLCIGCEGSSFLRSLRSPFGLPARLVVRPGLG